MRYRFSTVRGGEERFSPSYEVTVPSDDAIADLYRIPEEGAGNLPTAKGRGYFRLVLPLGEGERASGPFRFGFGAMRKNPPRRFAAPSSTRDTGRRRSSMPRRPSRSSRTGRCRTSCTTSPRTENFAPTRSRAPASPSRIPTGMSSPSGWSGATPRGGRRTSPSWRPRGGRPARPLRPSEFFSEDRAAFFAAREAALSLLPVPRVFEGFVFGPSGSGVEYCFQTVSRRPDGGFEVRWRNRESGGNWVVTL